MSLPVYLDKPAVPSYSKKRSHKETVYTFRDLVEDVNFYVPLLEYHDIIRIMKLSFYFMGMAVISGKTVYVPNFGVFRKKDGLSGKKVFNSYNGKHHDVLKPFLITFKLGRFFSWLSGTDSYLSTKIQAERRAKARILGEKILGELYFDQHKEELEKLVNKPFYTQAEKEEYLRLKNSKVSKPYISLR